MATAVAPDLGTLDDPASGRGPESPARGRFASVPLRSLLPGLAAALAVAAAGTALGQHVPLVGAPVFAIVIGMAVSAFRAPGTTLRPGLEFTGKRVLQGSIIVLGFGLSGREVLSTGLASLPVLLGTLVVALVVAWLAGRALRMRRDLNTLIGVGTAVCGASAIAATDSVIAADEADVSYAIATIFTFNVMAVLAYPTLGHLFGLSQHAFGLWSGTAINDTSSVVAASTVFGHAAASYGVVVKLTRTLAIVPICLGLAALRQRSSSRSTPARSGPAAPAPISVRRVFPLFILAFALAVALNSLGLVPAGAHRYLSDLAGWMITAALGAIGLSTRFGHIRKAGPRPILLGAILWATVGVTSLALQMATGTV
jgi:uncharacterized integral membrane protein (TIGR00698 family)